MRGLAPSAVLPTYAISNHPPGNDIGVARPPVWEPPKTDSLLAYSYGIDIFTGFGTKAVVCPIPNDYDIRAGVVCPVPSVRTALSTAQ